MKMFKFTTGREECELLRQIAARAAESYKKLGYDVPKVNFLMDLSITNANGCPLRLAEMLTADESDFMHDIAGINRHLNRETGKLEDLFHPRYAARTG